MSREQLSRPTQIIAGFSLTGLSDGIMSLYNSLLTTMSVGNNLYLDSNTLYLDEYPTIGILQDTNRSEPGTNNVGHGSGALDNISNNAFANSAMGTAALSQIYDSQFNSAFGYYSGASTQTDGGYSGFGNAFYGALAGVTYFCDFNPDDMPTFYGSFGTYLGSATNPSNNGVMGETAIGFMVRGSGQGTTTISNAISDMGTLTTNPGFEVFDFSGNYTPPAGSSYAPLPINSRYGINVYSDDGLRFYLPQAGIYSFTMRISQIASTPHVWTLYQIDSQENIISVTTINTAATGSGTNQEWLYVYDTSRYYYIMADDTDHSLVNATMSLAVKFESLYAD